MELGKSLTKTVTGLNWQQNSYFVKIKTDFENFIFELSIILNVPIKVFLDFESQEKSLKYLPNWLKLLEA